MTAATIYKLLTRAEWEAARTEGAYRGSAHDARDGFIHFSTAAQLGETARKYFAGVPDLVLLAVDVGALNERPAPHPVLLPMEEGTPERDSERATPSPLPGGEGQGEGSNLLWEPARDGDLFPHLYGDLPVSAVKRATPIPLAENGIPIIPGGLGP
ncbi:MAG: DUF952 domain-containing protein [Rhodomicrobium sp.]